MSEWTALADALDTALMSLYEAYDELTGDTGPLDPELLQLLDAALAPVSAIVEHVLETYGNAPKDGEGEDA